MYMSAKCLDSLQFINLDFVNNIETLPCVNKYFYFLMLFMKLNDFVNICQSIISKPRGTDCHSVTHFVRFA